MPVPAPRELSCGVFIGGSVYVEVSDGGFAVLLFDDDV